MEVTSEHHARHRAAVTVDGDAVTIEHLSIEDGTLADHLRDLDEAARTTALERIVAVGVRGVTSMGAGISMHEIRAEVERALADVVAATEAHVGEALEAGRRTLSESLDPDQRNSLTARTADELSSIHQRALEQLDLDRAGSHPRRLVAALEELLGPSGALEQRLLSALDPAVEGSALNRFGVSIEQRLLDLRDVVVGNAGRAEEARRGTAKGMAFEDEIEALLRTEAGRLGGYIVERTSRTPGALGPEAVVGDFTMTAPTGRSMVIEAKDVASIGLTGKSGILAELDRAATNRSAAVAICVSRCDAFPSEVGPFGVYGDRILVVDDGDGTMLGVALRWGRAMLEGLTASDLTDLDTEMILQRLARLRDLGGHFSRSKRTLSTVRSSIDGVRNELDDLRSQLIDMVDDIVHELRRAGARRTVPGRVA